MPKLPAQTLIAQCSCGKVEVKAHGAPIIHAACYCTDCQLGGQQLEALPAAAPLLDPDGGTSMLLYRKDRVGYREIEPLLTPYKLTAASPTTRFVASCCNSAMFLDFEKGHWLTLYRRRFSGPVPPLDMRVCTKSKRSDVTLPGDVPNLAGHSPRFFAKLIAAWIPMLLRL
jgi:hypothetical protein